MHGYVDPFADRARRRDPTLAPTGDVDLGQQRTMAAATSPMSPSRTRSWRIRRFPSFRPSATSISRSRR